MPRITKDNNGGESHCSRLGSLDTKAWYFSIVIPVYLWNGDYWRYLSVPLSEWVCLFVDWSYPIPDPLLHICRLAWAWGGQLAFLVPRSSSLREVLSVLDGEDYEMQWQIGLCVVFPEDQLKAFSCGKKGTNKCCMTRRKYFGGDCYCPQMGSPWTPLKFF